MSEKNEQELQLEPNSSNDTDVLLECLEILCHFEHHHFSKSTALANLPLVNHQLTPSLFNQAAERLGFESHLHERDLDDITHVPLPAIMILKDNQACVLQRIYVSGEVEVVYPATEFTPVRKRLTELADEYQGYIIAVNENTTYDDRAKQYHVSLKQSWFILTLLRYRGSLGQVILAALFINIFGTLSPLFVMNVYDRVVPNEAIETLWVLAIGISMIYAFDFILRELRGYLIDKVGKNADIKLSSMIFEKVMGLKLNGKPESAGAFSATLRDFEVVREMLTSSTLVLLIDLPFVFLFIWFLFIIGGVIAYVPLIAMPIVMLGAVFAEASLRSSVEKSLIGMSQKHAVLVESVANLETIKALGAEGYMQHRWEKYVTATAHHSLVSRFYSSLAVNFTLYVQHMVTVAIVVVGVYQIKAGNLSMGGLIACSILSGRALAPLGQIANIISRLQQSFISLRGLNRLMASPQERDHNRIYTHNPYLEGDIVFEKVSFSYPNQPIDALEEVSFHIEPGERVGIIGRSGSGKTTLEKLCLNFYKPKMGRVKIDGIDIGQMDPAVLRRNFGYNSDNSTLFFGTARENILMGDPTADEKTLLWAAEMSGISRHIKHHPMGFDLMVGESGVGLSNGQRQALCLARTLVKKPRILLLDEPTSHMDNTSESYVIKRLYDYIKGKTLLLITHKASLLVLVDRLIVIDGGRVVADGPKDQVLAALAASGKERQADGK